MDKKKSFVKVLQKNGNFNELRECKSKKKLVLLLSCFFNAAQKRKADCKGVIRECKGGQSDRAPFWSLFGELERAAKQV